MDLWLFALIAVALIPVVRVFIAAGCRRAPDAPGAESLFGSVNANGAIPDSSERANVRILRAELHVNPPEGASKDTAADGQINRHEFRVGPADFGADEPPYEWSASCTVDYECTSGPAQLLGRGSASAAADWLWDANRVGEIIFTLKVVDDARETGEVLPDPGLVHRYRWVLEGTGF